MGRVLVRGPALSTPEDSMARGQARAHARKQDILRTLRAGTATAAQLGVVVGAPAGTIRRLIICLREEGHDIHSIERLHGSPEYVLVEPVGTVLAP